MFRSRDRGPIGPLTFVPLIHILPDFLDMQNYIFMNHLSDPINLAQFQWNQTNLKLWPLYKRSMTFSYFDRYLKNETLYEFCVIEFFAPYDPRKNLTCITT